MSKPTIQSILAAYSDADKSAMVEILQGETSDINYLRARQSNAFLATFKMNEFIKVALAETLTELGFSTEEANDVKRLFYEKTGIQ